MNQGKGKNMGKPEGSHGGVNWLFLARLIDTKVLIDIFLAVSINMGVLIDFNHN